jgi:hypothetical protein
MDDILLMIGFHIGCALFGSGAGYLIAAVVDWFREDEIPPELREAFGDDWVEE